MHPSDQADAGEPAFFEVLEDRAPASLVLFDALADAENLPITLAAHPDRYQQRHVANLAGPAALEHDAIQVHVGMLTLDRPIAPGLDGCVDLLVQVRQGRRRNPRAPQSLRDVFDPPYRDAGQIHLDQYFLHRALAPPVALDDRRLEGLRPKVRNSGAARSRWFLLVVNGNDIAQRTRCSLGHGGSFSLTLLRLGTSSSARFGAASPIYLCDVIIQSALILFPAINMRAPRKILLAKSLRI